MPDSPRFSSSQFRTYIKRSVTGLLLLAAVVWSADWGILQIRISRGPDAFGSVEVHRSYAIHLKNKRIEQRNELPHDEECVRSLFPHNSESACWYLQRHANQDQDMNSAPWRFYKEE